MLNVVDCGLITIVCALVMLGVVKTDTGLDVHFNPSGFGTRVFQENKVKAIIADALGPCVARLSATIILTI